jgi:hypothetical protein
VVKTILIGDNEPNPAALIAATLEKGEPIMDKTLPILTLASLASMAAFDVGPHANHSRGRIGSKVQQTKEIQRKKRTAKSKIVKAARRRNR